MNDYLQTRELYHHGIKGMKWGVIKEDYQIHKRTSQRKKESASIGRLVGGLAGAGLGVGTVYLIGKGHVFSRKPDGKGFLRDIYTKKAFWRHKFESRMFILGSTFVGSMMGAKIGKYHAGRKSAEENLKDIQYQNLSDRQKTQLSKSGVLNHSINDENIIHSGIKGQRWGIRRYQNEDGSLTEEGKKRYSQIEYKSKNKKKEQKKDTFEKKKQEKSDNIEKSKKEQELTKNAIGISNTASSVAKDASTIAKTAAGAIDTSKGSVAIRKSYPYLTDQELQSRINRLNLERTYGDLSGDTKYVKSGKEKAREVLQTLGAALAIASTSLGIYETIRRNIGKKST